MRKRRMSLAGLAGVVLLTASPISHGPALALDGEWPAQDWSGPTAQAGTASAYADPTYDPGKIFGFDFTPDDCPGMQRRNQAVGGLLGGVVGGLIGSGVGKGSGKTAATISGALLGALGGALLGNQVAEAGEACLPEPAYGLAPAGDRPASPLDLY